MTNEEDAIRQAEEALDEALSGIKSEALRERTELLPHLARQIRSTLSAETGEVYVAVMRPSNTDPSDKSVLDPLMLRGEPIASTAAIAPFHHWDNITQAIEALSNPIASVLYNENHNKQSPNALVLYVHKGIALLYGNDIITVAKHIAGDEWIVKNADINTSDPDEFFQANDATAEERELAIALITLKEQGGNLERQSPKAYKVFLGRIREAFNERGETDQ